jgi:PEP-CTERM motif
MFKRFQHISAMRPALATTAFALGALSLNAQAQVTHTTYMANGVNLVSATIFAGTKNEYSYTTTQDANLFATIKASYGDKDNDGVNDLVEAILAVSPTVTFHDGDTGTVSAQDLFFNNGYITYQGSLAFLNYLNSISYAGSNQWYIPNNGNLNLLTFTVTDKLSNAEGYYWSSTEYPSVLETDSDGNEMQWVWYLKNYDYEAEYAPRTGAISRAIFVTKGLIADVSAVPEPASVTLLLAGLGVLGAVARRRKQQR